MRRNDPTGHWRRTRMVAMATLITTAVVLGLALIAGATLNGLVVLGVPVGFFFIATGAIVILTGLVFWHAERQDMLDRTYRMAEDD